MENNKRIEYYINRIQSLNDKEDDIKLVIEDSFEKQEKQYDKNKNINNNSNHGKDMSLVPLFIVITLAVNLTIYNMFGDDYISFPFITFAVSLYLLYKYVPLKSKKKFISDFERNVSNIKNFFSRENKKSKLQKYIGISSDDDQKELLNEEDNNDNFIDSPLLNI